MASHREVLKCTQHVDILQSRVAERERRSTKDLDKPLLVQDASGGLWPARVLDATGTDDPASPKELSAIAAQRREERTAPGTKGEGRVLLRSRTFDHHR